MDSAPAVSTPRAGSWPSGSWRVPWRQSCQPLSCISSVHAGGEEEGPLPDRCCLGPAQSGVRLGEAGQGPGALQLEPVSARRRQSTSRAPCARSCPGRPLAQAPARRWVGGRPRRFPGPCPRGMVPRTPWPDAPRLRGEAGFCHPKRHSVGWGRVARRWEGVAGWLRSEGVSLARWAADLSSQQQQACPWDVQVWRLSPAWCLASGGECGTSVWWCFGGRT